MMSRRTLQKALTAQMCKHAREAKRKERAEACDILNKAQREHDLAGGGVNIHLGPVDFKLGMRVRIINRAHCGEDIDEGIARIVKINQGDRGGVHADVIFDGDEEAVVQRWVFAKDQYEL